MKKTYYILLILATFFSHVFINYQILNNSQVIRVHDEHNRIRQGLVYYKELFSLSNTNIIKKFNSILYLDKAQAHPHLFELVEAVTWKVLEGLKIGYNNILKDIDLMILVTNSLFLLILLFSIYGIGSVLYNQGIGLLSALFISTFPLIFGHSRIAMLDFSLTAMISLSIYLLLKTSGFQSILYSVFTGISFGLSQLTKEAAIIFIFTPLIYYFIKSYIAVKKNKVILNFMITVLLFVAIAAIVYLNPINQDIFKIYFGKICYIRGAPDPLYYFKNFKKIIGPYILVLSLPFLLSYLVNLKNREKLLFFWFFIPIILFSLSQNKALRFILPVLPGFSLIVIQEIFNNNLTKKIKGIICFVFILASILQYALFNSGFLNKQFTGDYLSEGILFVTKDPYLDDASRLLSIFEDEKAYMKRPTKLLFLDNINKFVSFLRFFGFDCYSPMEGDITRTIINAPFDCDQIIKNHDYIIESVPIYPFPNYFKGRSSCLRDSFAKYRSKFKKVFEIKIFDGHNLYIYKKI